MYITYRACPVERHSIWSGENCLAVAAEKSDLALRKHRVIVCAFAGSIALWRPRLRFFINHRSVMGDPTAVFDGKSLNWGNLLSSVGGCNQAEPCVHYYFEIA